VAWAPGVFLADRVSLLDAATWLMERTIITTIRTAIMAITFFIFTPLDHVKRRFLVHTTAWIRFLFALYVLNTQDFYANFTAYTFVRFVY
jgi:exosortase/archaeosortase